MDTLDLKGLLRCYLTGRAPAFEELPDLAQAPATLRGLSKTIVAQVPKVARGLARKATDPRVSDWLERLGTLAEEDLRGRP